jgi:Kef-type K+ transport system membrane component KefB
VSNGDLTSILFVLLLLVGLAHLFGYLFVKLRQPKVVGEIVAGIVLGPAVVGRFPFATGLTDVLRHQGSTLNFVYWLGLLLLMFLSGAETRHLFSREEWREVAWLAILGTGIPFVLALMLGPWLIRPALAGPNSNRISLIIILAVGVAVTSVPVVSKIFGDFKNTPHSFRKTDSQRRRVGRHRAMAGIGSGNGFSRESRAETPADVVSLDHDHRVLWPGLTIVPRIVKRISKSSFNIFAKHSPVAYAIAILLGYCVIAGALDISVVFAAFLAGFAVVHKKRRLFSDALDAIGKVSFAFFIPVYFALVGLKLDLIQGFSLWMTAIFLVGSCVIKILSVSLAGRCAGFRGLDLLNLAVTTNARGGPGIVLASVAFDAGIISPEFYTTLVIAAVLTSQMAGAWLDYVLRKGWPLLTAVAKEESAIVSADASPSAA